PTRLQDVVRIANNLMDKKLKGYAVKNAKNKRSFDTNHRDNRGCKLHHKGHCTVRFHNCRRIRHLARGCRTLSEELSQSQEPKPQEQGKSSLCKRQTYVLGGGDANPGSNTVTGTFLLNNHHAYILFDSGADRSFVSNAFSTLLDITPSALDVSYAFELADRRTSKTSTVLKSYTLGLVGHPFNIDLMPIDLGSFDISSAWIV
nr:reverse transcriptase domain-containing protein [Tanacetum cinerariifolium]